MKKTAILLLSALVIMTIASCASTTDGTVVLGKDGVPRPDWVTANISTDEIHYEVGYAKLSNFANSRSRALANGRELLAQWVNTFPQFVTTYYGNDAGEGENRQFLDVFETLSIERSNAWLRGSTQEEIWIDAEDGVWVLVSIPVANVTEPIAELAEEVAEQEFSENEAAAAANAKMNEAIERYFGSLSN